LPARHAAQARGCADRFGGVRGRADLFPEEDVLPPAMPTEPEIRDWCLAYVRRIVDDAGVAVGTDIGFAEMGLDSATSAYFLVELEEWVGVELEPELVFDYPTIAELARHIVERRANGNAGNG
jgi:acyl carrier protein